MSWEEWLKISSSSDCGSNAWTDIILQYISSINPYCSFAFKRKWKKVPHSRKTSPAVFRCYGYCTFKECPVTFHAYIPNYDTETPLVTLPLFVHFASSSMKHLLVERKSRHIRGQFRQQLREELDHQSPSTLHNKLYCSLSKQEIQSGKRDKVGSSVQTIEKISSESNLQKRCHFDVVTSLSLLREQQLKLSTGTKVKGYVQQIYAHPFAVMCYTEEGIRMYHHLAKTHCLYFDATGTIVSLKKTDYHNCSAPYYSLVLQHPHKGNPPVAVTELITTEHSVMSIFHFIEAFRRSEYVIYGYNNVIMPQKVVIDRSITLLLVFLKDYNQETLSGYFHRCFRILLVVLRFF